MRYLPTLLAILLGSPISGAAVANEQPIVVSADLLREIRAAPESLTLGVSVLRMTAYAWRNFMPAVGINADGRPMAASIKIMLASGPSVAHRVTAVWILQGETIWQSHDLELPGNSTANPYEIIVRDGPRLQPHSQVDFVVRIVDRNSATHFLAARNQIINAVE